MGGGAQGAVCIWPAEAEDQLAPASSGGKEVAAADAVEAAELEFPVRFCRSRASEAGSAWLRGVVGPAAATFDLECHPGSLALALRGQPRGLRECLVEKAFRWVETVKGVALSRQGRRLLTAQPAPSEARESGARPPLGPEAVKDLAKGTGAAGMSDGLLSDLASLGVGGGNPAARGAEQAPPAEPAGAEPKPGRVLIQEISAGEARAPPPLAYAVEDDASSRGLRVTFQVPGVAAISQLSLEASPEALSVRLEDGSAAAEVPLPPTVDMQAIRAKLDKKRGLLRVSLPGKAPA